ncbi:MAG: beta-lactamase family protein [Bryobacterales bacterium]|nr:beta-lactamase family protein [Bryobacterales bacterium]
MLEADGDIAGRGMADGVGKAFLGAAKQGMRVRWRERREVVVEVEVNVPPGDAGGEQAEGLGKAGGEFAAPGSDGIAGDLEAFAEAVVMLLAGSLAAQTGTAVAELAGLDAAMQTYLKEGKTPGGALAVSRGGKLIYARGFGVMETERNTPVQPDSLFRVGSVSKPVTAMAALRLVQDGKLRLEDGVVTLLGLPASQIADPRWNEITVRHLLQHSGGWDAGGVLRSGGQLYGAGRAGAVDSLAGAVNDRPGNRIHGNAAPAVCAGVAVCLLELRDADAGADCGEGIGAAV